MRPGINLRNMSLRDLSSLLSQIARELQNRDRGGGFRPRAPQGPGSWDRGERPSYGGPRPAYGGGGGGGGGGGWKRGPRRERPGGRFPGGAEGSSGGGFPAEGSAADDAGNREGANEGRFGGT